MFMWMEFFFRIMTFFYKGLLEYIIYKKFLRHNSSFDVFFWNYLLRLRFPTVYRLYRFTVYKNTGIPVHTCINDIKTNTALQQYHDLYRFERYRIILDPWNSNLRHLPFCWQLFSLNVFFCPENLYLCYNYTFCNNLLVCQQGSHVRAEFYRTRY